MKKRLELFEKKTSFKTETGQIISEVLKQIE